ncbi:glycosyltransferase family protein [Nocardioides allogilvus]|uniref:glycosyltransferase family protein n=1 Tax=Nocardioides allogilvus TaxID=2072017 RepID=UPI000D2FC853|nr:glycosyltransferase [Nocardioides allogilvus]
MDASARVVVASRRSVEQQVWHASTYELEDVIADVDDVDWCLPRPGRGGPAGRLTRGALNRAGRVVGRDRRAVMSGPAGPPREAELFFTVFADANEIGMLPHLAPQVQAASKRVAWIVELWSAQVPGVADYLRQLRGFDHVIVSNQGVVDAVADLTGVPCSYLPTAVDMLRYAPPGPAEPSRSVDVVSYGRRLTGTHAPLLAALREGSLFYHYDTVRGPWEVTGHAEHRTAQAALLQRARFSVVYKINDEPGRLARTGGEESLTTRYFEAQGAGALILGTAPDSPEWADAFPWTDAIFPVPAPAPHVVDVIEELDRDPERLARARHAAVTTSLRRHDWAHRWRDVLDAVGLAPGPRLAERIAQLEARARAWDALA